MELTLAILMVLGIFVGIPALIGFAIAGTYIVVNRQAHKVERAKAVEAVAKALREQPAEAVVGKRGRKRVAASQR